MRLIATVIVLLAPVVLAPPVHAQEPTPDTTSAWRYFPLEVGNVWEYEQQGELPYAFERVSVIATNEHEGQSYFTLAHEQIDDTGGVVEVYVWEARFDTLAASVFVWYNDMDRPFSCPLTASFDDVIDCYGCTATTSGGYALPLTIGGDEVTATQKWFDTQGCEQYYSYAADIGRVAQGGWLSSLQLHYALVGGIEYGRPFTVASESAPPKVAALALAVFPNPSSGTATVRFSLDRPQRVTLSVRDVLGREVAVLHEGPLSAGDHRFPFDATALPAGTYYARVGSGGAHTTASVTVVR